MCEVPPRVEYELSDLATTLIPHAAAPANWAIEHNPDIDAHREAYDASAGDSSEAKRQRRS